jgi:hypothetical protein
MAWVGMMCAIGTEEETDDDERTNDRLLAGSLSSRSIRKQATHTTQYKKKNLLLLVSFVQFYRYPLPSTLFIVIIMPNTTIAATGSVSETDVLLPDRCRRPHLSYSLRPPCLPSAAALTHS